MPIPIESFNIATQERSYDMSLMKKNERKICEMHLGGIVIEKLIKYIIVTYYGIEEREGIWNWIAKKNIPRTGYIIKNPSHKLMQGIQRVDNLKDKVDSNISRLIGVIQNPCGIDYIDLRYYTGIVSDDEYNEWKLAFSSVKKWLIKNIYIL